MAVSNNDYQEMSQKLKEILNLDKSPVAVKLFKTEDEALENLSKVEPKTHCQHVFDTAMDEEFGYATLEEQTCPRGAYALGLTEQEMKGAYKLDEKMGAVGYAPLEKATFVPDAILIYGIPLQTLTVAQKYMNKCNNRFKADFSGKQSLCADAVSIPYKTGESNITFGCRGSRGFTDIKPEEMIISLTLNDAQAIIND